MENLFSERSMQINSASYEDCVTEGAIIAYGIYAVVAIVVVSSVCTAGE